MFRKSVFDYKLIYYIHHMYLYMYIYTIALPYLIAAVNHRIMMTETEVENVIVIEDQIDQIV